MKKQVIVALAISISAFSFAQKKELKTADKAIKSNNFAAAKTALNQAHAYLPAMDEKVLAQYYLLKGEALYANGKGSAKDINEALECLDEADDVYTAEVITLKSNMTKSFLATGNAAYEAKNYSKAADYFEKSYRVSPRDTVYLYFAATMAVNVPDYDSALVMYEELNDLGYTGIITEYYATNATTGKEEVLDKQTRDLYVKAKTYTNPGSRVSDSKKSEIVTNMARIYRSKGQNEKAISAMKEARAMSPNDVNLVLAEANLQYKVGNTEEFKKLLKKAVEMDPKNPELQYNLGVIAAETNHPDEAKQHYKKAIELDPNYSNAYINLAALILGEEKPLIDEMNGLGTSRADDLRYDELRKKRKDLYKEAVPYLEKAFNINRNNVNAAKTLMNIYSILGETEKAKEMKERVAELENTPQ